MKLVSVLLPCYNSERYISEAIQSILDQTYTHFELLILDDGSTDNTKSIITGFQDKRVILLTENENKGIVYQLNKGIEHAKGEFIARMDADDVSFPERFQKQVEFLENPKNFKIDVLGTDAVSIGSSSKSIIHQNYRSEQISFMLNFKCPILHPTVLIRRRVFDQGKRYPQDYVFAEDYALWRLIDKGDNLAIIPNILLSYRIHDNQTNKSDERFQIQMEAAIRVAFMRPVSVRDQIFLSDKIKRNFFQNSAVKHIKLNLIERFYLKIIKKYLNIKYHQLNELIKQ
jgi:glycosyltransferase involved in cell wall biosynthesis